MAPRRLGNRFKDFTRMGLRSSGRKPFFMYLFLQIFIKPLNISIKTVFLKIGQCQTVVLPCFVYILFVKLSQKEKATPQ